MAMGISAGGHTCCLRRLRVQESCIQASSGAINPSAPLSTSEISHLPHGISVNRPTILVNAIPLVHIATGIGRYVRELYGALERLHGHEATFLYFDGRVASPTMPQPTADLGGWSKNLAFLWKLPPHLALCIRLAFHARREWAFARVLREHAVAVYHETAFFPFHTPSTLATVFTVHDLSLQRHPQWHPRERVLYAQCFFRRRLRKVNHFLTVSEFSKRELMDWAGVSPDRISPTPLAHDSSLFHVPSAEHIAAIRQTYSLPERFFLFLGSGDPRKNAAIIPQALRAAELDIPLISVGWSGWGDAADDSQPRSLGYVPDKDLAALYGAALALIYPSRYEGFGLPVLEAMACGCPVVTTREASLPEAGGEAALYMEHPDDVAGLGELLRALATDSALAKRACRQGLAHTARFSWDATATATWEVLCAATRNASNTDTRP